MASDSGEDLPPGWTRLKRTLGLELIRMAVEAELPTNLTHVKIKICGDPHVGSLSFRALPLSEPPADAELWPPPEAYSYTMKALHILLVRGLMPESFDTLVDQVHYTEVVTAYGSEYKFVFMPMGKYVPVSNISMDDYFAGIHNLYATTFASVSAEGKDRDIQHALTQHTETSNTRMMAITHMQCTKPIFHIPVYSPEGHENLPLFFNNVDISPGIRVLASMLIQDNLTSSLNLAIKVAQSLLGMKEEGHTTHLKALYERISAKGWEVLSKPCVVRYIRVCQLYLEEFTNADVASNLLTCIVRE